MNRAQILVIEDDASIAAGVALNLRVEGYDAVIAGDGAAGLAELERLRPQLVLLDLSLPRKNGFEVIADVRGRGDHTPIIVLSARDAEADVVAALKLGADDYVTKPFALAELLARVAAVLRRASAAPVAAPVAAPQDDAGEIRFGQVRINLATRQVVARGREVKLTKLEFELLVYLARHAGRVLPRERLLRDVWDVAHDGSARTVDNFVAQLRAKIEDDPDAPRHVVTVRGAGYRFDP
jgi:two-component system alkaline phosphatase synthesis response regulator PhoP